MGIPLIASQDLVSIDWTIVAQIIAFLILLYILARLLYNPLNGALETRAQRIRTELGAAEEAARAAQEAEQRTQAQLEQARAQAQEILRQANANAETIRTQIVDEARTEAQRVIDRGQAEIERQRQAAIEDLRRTVGDLAIMAATQVVQKSLDSSENRRLVEDAIAQSAAFRAESN